MSMIKIIRFIDFIVLLHKKNSQVTFPFRSTVQFIFAWMTSHPKYNSWLFHNKEKEKQPHITTFPNTVTCFLFHLVVHGLSGKGETDCNLPLFTFIFFWLIEKLLWNVLPLLTSACCFLQKLFFLGTPQSFDEAKKTNMEQTFRSMVFFVCLMTSVVVLVLTLLTNENFHSYRHTDLTIPQ